jgi:hypothetical protein
MPMDYRFAYLKKDDSHRATEAQGEEGALGALSRADSFSSVALCLCVNPFFYRALLIARWLPVAATFKKSA